MKREGLRRVEVWLPVNHHVFRLPPGARAAYIRACINFAEALEEIRERLDRIEAKLESGVLPDSDPSPRKNRVEIDPAAFFDI
ncbi:hypothetical protein Adeg_0814 [Ammonifex degensii KC4]|uniref:Uncharacterized protein n=1 Tax=Ammonifex degensii (strain DSM 10501 / KC4) TaxID=429009 RepID=C9RCH9_AMMDK|nr:hypothetical protein [Ammonifex degensii]ACX51956.1 hypothetical protein Adeg_0814 [Ammonifex degensii KC4]